MIQKIITSLPGRLFTICSTLAMYIIVRNVRNTKTRLEFQKRYTLKSYFSKTNHPITSNVGNRDRHADIGRDKTRRCIRAWFTNVKKRVKYNKKLNNIQS